jgi:hypothetical protein
MPKISQGDLINMLFALKETKATLNEQLKEVNGELASVEYQILQNMEASGLEKQSTELGTVSKKVELYPKVEDFEEFVNFIAEEGRYEMIQKRPSPPQFRAYYEETGAYPDGLDAFDKVTLNTRKK